MILFIHLCIIEELELIVSQTLFNQSLLQLSLFRGIRFYYDILVGPLYITSVRFGTCGYWFKFIGILYGLRYQYVHLYSLSYSSYLE